MATFLCKSLIAKRAGRDSALLLQKRHERPSGAANGGRLQPLPAAHPDGDGAAQAGQQADHRPEGIGAVGERDAGDIHAERTADHRQRHEDHGHRRQDEYRPVHLVGAGVEDLLVHQHRPLGQCLQLLAKAGGPGGGFPQADPVTGTQKGQILDLERVEHVALRPDEPPEGDQRPALLGERRADVGSLSGHQGLLDVVETVSHVLDQRLQAVGGAQPEPGDEIGRGHRRLLGLLPLGDPQQFGNVEFGGNDHALLLEQQAEELPADLLGVRVGTGDPQDHQRLVLQHGAAGARGRGDQDVGVELPDLLLQPRLELRRAQSARNQGEAARRHDKGALFLIRQPPHAAPAVEHEDRMPVLRGKTLGDRVAGCFRARLPFGSTQPPQSGGKALARDQRPRRAGSAAPRSLPRVPWPRTARCPACGRSCRSRRPAWRCPSPAAPVRRRGR